MESNIFQVVVIGSGPGGAVTASILSEQGKNVLLLEEGRPTSAAAPFSRQEMQDSYRHGGMTFTYGSPKISYVEGSCLGGGSEINSGLYHRTPDEVLEEWRTQFDLRGATAEDMRPHFEYFENILQISKMPYTPSEASLKLHEGAQKLNWKSYEVPRWYGFEKTSDNHWRSFRRSMAKTFIPQAIEKGCQVLTGVRVEKISKQGSLKVLHVRGANGSSHTYKAETVFVCAGAIHTPTLLLKSGLGTHVGRSLQMHPTLKMVAEYDHPVLTAKAEVPVHQVKEFSPAVSFGCSVASLAHTALALVNQEQGFTDYQQRYAHMAVYYAMIRPQAVASIHLPFFSKRPFIKYQLHKQDFDLLEQGYRNLMKLLFAAGAQKIFPSISNVTKPYLPGQEGQLPCFADYKKYLQLMTVHVFSSCPMGEDRAKCAVDSFGRLHGETGIYVNDASLLPNAPGVNPQGSIMAFARRNVLRFLAEDKK